MFESDYLEFKSKVKQEVKEVVFRSMAICKVLEEKQIYYYSHSMERPMDIIDRYSFATLIAILDNDSRLNNYFEKQGVGIEKITGYLGISLDNISELYSDQLQAEFLHGYGYFLRKMANTYDWTQINVIDLANNVIYEYNDDSDAIKSFFKDNNINITDISKGILKLAETDALEEFKSSKETNNLNGFGYYLTGNTGRNIKGREKEIRDLEASLIAPGNVIITGEAGVGKTAIVEHLAYLINHDRVPNILKGKKLFFLDLVKVIANTTYRGDLEAKLDRLIRGLEKDENTILFIDEIHMVMGAGKGSGDNIDIANIMKHYLSDRKIQIIGATTTEEYQKYVLEDKAFRRRFNKIVVTEPNDEVLYDILESKKIEYEKQLNIKLEDSDKAIKLLIEATRTNHRDYRDNTCNPTLSLNILGRSFAYAAVDSRKILTTSDLADSILNEETLYKGCREDYANKLKKEKVKTLSKDDKIIRFPKK